MPTLPDILMFVKANVNSAKQGLQQVRDETGRLSESMGTLKQAGAMAAGMLLRDMVNSATAAIDEFAQLGGQIDTLRISFDRLKDAHGATTLSLETLRKATYDMVSDVDLLKQANQAMLLGLPTDQFDDLTNAAIRLGYAQGYTATKSVESLTMGIGRQSRLMLDNLGVIVKAEDAYTWYAKQLEKTSSELTESEKRLGWQKYAIEKVRKSALALGDNISDTAKKQAQWNTRIKNLKTAIGDMLGPLGTYIAQIVNVLGPAIPVLTVSYGKLFIAKMADVGATAKQKLADFAAAAAAIAHKVATWALNAALSVKIGLLTLGAGLIAAAAATTLYLAQMTREAAEAEEEFGAEIIEINDVLIEQKERLDDVSASAQKFLNLVSDLEHDFNLMQAEAAKSLWLTANMFDEAFSEGRFTEAAKIVKVFAKRYAIGFSEAEQVIRDFIEKQKEIPDAIDESLVDKAQSAIQEFKECSRDKMLELQDTFEDVKARLREKWQIGAEYGGTRMEAYRMYKAELASAEALYEHAKTQIHAETPRIMAAGQAATIEVNLPERAYAAKETRFVFKAPLIVVHGTATPQTIDYAVTVVQQTLKNVIVESTSKSPTVTTKRIRTGTTPVVTPTPAPPSTGGGGAIPF